MEIFHDLALEINPALASDIARIAFMYKQHIAGQSSAYADWDAGQDLYDISKHSQSRDKNTELLRSFSWDKDDLPQERTAFARSVFHNQSKTWNNDIMVNLIKYNHDHSKFMDVIANTLIELTVSFTQKIGHITSNDNIAFWSETSSFIEENLYSPHFKGAFIDFMKKRISANYNINKKRKLLKLSRIKSQNYPKPHKQPCSLIKDAHIQYELSRRPRKQPHLSVERVIECFHDDRKTLRLSVSRIFLRRGAVYR